MVGIKEKLEEENEKAKGLKVADFVAAKDILSEDSNQPLYEGEIARYKPGISVSYIARWAQVTRKDFKCYKNRVNSTQWLAKPLSFVPLNLIDRVARVDVNVTKGKKQSKGVQWRFQFEIFLKSRLSVQWAEEPGSSKLPRTLLSLTDLGSDGRARKGGQDSRN